MNQINTVIELNRSNVSTPLRTIETYLLSSHVVAVVRAPDDVQNVRLRIFRPSPNNSQYFTVSLVLHPTGTWTGLAVPGTFPDTGSSRYEIHADDAHGNLTVLGAGTVRILSRITNGTEAVATAMDANGTPHVISAVNLNGEWSLAVN